ncbi:MAG: class II aldolase/adducin family protein [Butyrivibrio sp.]|nr:class II aldolase/adducin family protein [Butyrivibrio sp.]
MSYEEKKQEIIDVCNKLMDLGLLVRTWGNVSCKIDDNHFLITPSGIRYENLTVDKIVLVNSNDLSYEGDILPSSEKAVHAKIYNVRKDAEFIVHTHQPYATAVGALGHGKIRLFDEDNNHIIIPIISYALPGTQKLADNAGRKTVKYSSDNAFIMANHGTICFGQTSKEAIKEALQLEVRSMNFLKSECRTDFEYGLVEGFSSHIENGKIIYDLPDVPARIKNIHEEIYSTRHDINYIIHNKSDAITTVSRTANHMRPLNDDFAQLIGVSVKIPSRDDGHDKSHINVSNKCNVVFSFNDGAFCLGSNKSDAEAVALVLDKGCLAHIAVMRFGEGHFLSIWDCIKMNRNYKKHYSRLADN